MFFLSSQYKKSLFSLSIFLSLILSSGFFAINKKNKELKWVSQKSFSRNLSEFIKIKDDKEVTKEPKTLLEDFFTTITGSKLLSEKYIQLKISELLENDSKFTDSDLFLKIKNKNHIEKQLIDNKLTKLKEENIDSYNDELSWTKNDENKYKKWKLMEKMKDEFLFFVSENQNIYIDNIKVDNYTQSEFKALKEEFSYSEEDSSTQPTPPITSTNKKIISFKTESSTDSFMKYISEFWDFIFGEWITSKKPISIKKITFPYANSFEKDSYSFPKETKKLIKLPNKPNYFFPWFSETEKNKFKSFIENINNLPAIESTAQKELIAISDIPNSDISSQAAIAYLTLYKTKDEEAPAKVTEVPQQQDQKSILSTITDFFYSSTEKKHCNLGWYPGINKIPEINSSSFKDLEILKALCINRNNFSRRFSSHDMYKLSNDSGQKFFLYKDKIGAHIIFENKINIKKFLIKNALIKKFLLLNKNSKINIISTLNNFMKKNFYILMMKFLNKEESKNVSNVVVSKVQKRSTIQQPTQSIYEKIFTNTFINSLIALLDEDSKKSQIIKLRTKVLKDYFLPMNQELILQNNEKNNFKKKINLSKGFQGIFPFKMDIKNSRKSLIKYLESIFEEPNVNSNPPSPSTATTSVPTDNTTTKSQTSPSYVAFEKEIKKASDSLSFEKDTSKKTWNLKEEQTTTATDYKNDIFEIIFMESIKQKYLFNLLIYEVFFKKIKNFSIEQAKHIDNLSDDDFWKNFLPKQQNNNATTQNSSTTNSTTKTDEYLQQLVIKNLLHLNNYDLFASAPTRFIFKDFDPKSFSKNQLNEFWKKQDITQKFEYSNIGNDKINNENTNFFKEWISIYWLMSNNFSEYKKYLKKILKNSRAAYVFTKKFNPKTCESINNIKELSGTKESDDWKTLNLDEKEYNSVVSSHQETIRFSSGEEMCSNIYDNFQISTLKVNQKDFQIVGYKGLVHEKNYENIKNLPINFFQTMNTFLKSSWSSVSDLNNNITSAKNIFEISKILDELENLLQSIEFRPKIILNNHFQHEILRKQKIKLKDFISKTFPDSIPLTIKTETKTNDKDEKTIGSEIFQRFQGNFFEMKNGKKNFYIQNNENEAYLAYAIQLKKDDLTDSNFSDFLKNTIGYDMFLYDLVKLSKSKEIQDKAHKHYLDKNKDWNNKKIGKFILGDYRMDKYVDFDWKS